MPDLTAGSFVAPESIDLDCYASLLTEKDVVGMDLANLVANGVEAESADKCLVEWGIPNKYHRKRLLRKLALCAQ